MLSGIFNFSVYFSTSRVMISYRFEIQLNAVFNQLNTIYSNATSFSRKSDGVVLIRFFYHYCRSGGGM